MPIPLFTSQSLLENPAWINGETRITGLSSAMNGRSGVILFHAGVSNACGSHQSPEAGPRHQERVLGAAGFGVG